MPTIAYDAIAEHSLWSVDIERKAITPNMFATIHCKNGCGFFEKALFKRKGMSACPECENSPLEVSDFNGRNASVSAITEKFALDITQSAIDTCPELTGRYFVKRGVVCPQLGLSSGSEADLAILNKDVKGTVSPDAIKCLFEVKMSFIWNWSEQDLTAPIADYDGHAGRPSIFRTDSILKAIGKAAITRGYKGSERIPFVVVGNTPPAPTYRDKVDGTVRSGLIQKWVSLTPNPLVVEPRKLPDTRNPKSKFGFSRIDGIGEFQKLLAALLNTEWVHIGAMVDPKKIGKIIKSLDLNRSADEIGYDFLKQLPKASSIDKI